MSLLKVTPHLLNDNSFLFYKNDIGIYALQGRFSLKKPEQLFGLFV